MARRKPKSRAEQVLAGEVEHAMLICAEEVKRDRVHLCVRGFRIDYRGDMPLLIRRTGVS